MHALPAAPPPAPRRQVLVGTTLACMAGIAMYAGMIGLYFRFRQEALGVPGAEWKPAASKVPEVATNNMLISFLAVFVFAQWAVYAARRRHTTYTVLALSLTALVGVAIVNAQAFVYRQMRLGVADGTYQTFFYSLTGVFVMLMVAGIVFSLVAMFRYLGGRHHDSDVLAAHAVYWYFVGAVYTALWFVVYVTK
jgi:heme/copper-type cytochrome/quinol oxidase subunit 3